MATCCLIFLATFSLEYLFFSDNFSIAYVVSHSNRDLSTFYKIAALWRDKKVRCCSGAFCWPLCFFGVAHLQEQERRVDALRRRGDGRSADFLPDAEQLRGQSVQGAGVAGADGVMHYVARVMQRVDAAAAISGNGDSPAESLFRVHRVYNPVCFALGALLARYPGEKWIHLTRKWTMIAWMFQSMAFCLAHTGLMQCWMGGYWAGTQWRMRRSCHG